MKVERIDNVGVVVKDFDAAIPFFTELGLAPEGRMPNDGEWAGRVMGVRGQHVEIAMMRTPDGYSRIELSRFDAPRLSSRESLTSPPTTRSPRNASRRLSTNYWFDFRAAMWKGSSVPNAAQQQHVPDGATCRR